MPTDPRELRDHALLLDAWLRFHEEVPLPFTIPGHKQRHDLVGDVVAGDVPLYAGLDTMKLSQGVLAEAEGRAAQLWGAELCRFSVGGATHGNQALALALAGGGDGDSGNNDSGDNDSGNKNKVVVSRTLHRSMLSGLALAGLDPVWVRPEVDARTGLPRGVTPGVVDEALERNPGVRGVLVGDPSYVGTVGDVAGLAEVAHRHGVPLVVDAAWAAHFGFHPDLPPHALALGADAMVVSAHKTLPAWSQAALVLARARSTEWPTGLDPARFDAAVEATHTTSPAGAILASIDASRALLEREGDVLLGEVTAAVRATRARLTDLDGLILLDGPDVDPLKLTLVLSGTGANGIDVENDLLVQGTPVEMADRDTIVAQVSIADDAVTLGRLADALVASIGRRRGSPRAVVTASSYAVDPVTVLSPREAWFAPARAVPVEEAIGRVSAELVAPYPPGIPVLAPGEQVTGEVVKALLGARDAGVRIAYAADPSLATLRVVDN